MSEIVSRGHQNVVRFCRRYLLAYVKPNLLLNVLKHSFYVKQDSNVTCKAFLRGGGGCVSFFNLGSLCIRIILNDHNYIYGFIKLTYRFIMSPNTKKSTIFHIFHHYTESQLFRAYDNIGKNQGMRPVAQCNYVHS